MFGEIFLGLDVVVVVPAADAAVDGSLFGSQSVWLASFWQNIWDDCLSL